MPETEFIGMLVLALISLFTLFKLIVQPLLDAMTKLTKSLTTLNVTVGNLDDKVDGMQVQINKNAENSHASHRRLWAHNDEQDKQLNDHEKRIHLLEHCDSRGPGGGGYEKA